MISFYFETCDFTNNANFIHFKWTLKRKHFTQLKFSEWRSVVIFHILQRNFPNVHMKIVLCSAKSLEFLCFITLFSTGTYLFIVWLKHCQNRYIFPFYSQVANNCSNEKTTIKMFQSSSIPKSQTKTKS